MSATLQPHDLPSPEAAPCPAYRLLGVTISDVTKGEACDLIEESLLRSRTRGERARTFYFVNAHTLNLASEDGAYRELLNRGDYVLGDGTGVRWGARLQGIRVKDNLVGTDLTPALFERKAGQGYSYFLLGSDEATIASAAAYARKEFPGWIQAGFHHGYLKEAAAERSAIEAIRGARPDVLLVGMGNPIQERWLERWASELPVGACLGIGGLFDYWAGNVSRAPAAFRTAGYEWVWRLYQQPRAKAKRYLVGNPQFLYRLLRERLAVRRRRLATTG
jgi:N-acetylglucosaminyldiphosphoundecaprenol N-acetyl-beta-D-mannosaminyltransferase